MALTNGQYETIMRDYSEQQRLNRLELRKRRDFIEETIPAYPALEQRAAELSIFYGKQLLNGDETAREALHKELDALAQQKAALLKEHDLANDYLTAPCQCADCHDTGFVRDENGNSVKCHCFKQKEITLLFETSGLFHLETYPDFSTLSENDYPAEHRDSYRVILEKARRFVADFPAGMQNLLFFGNVGTGKTYLSACMAKALMKQGYSVMYSSAAGLFELMGDNTFSHDTAGHMHHIFNCDLLIIDDLGTEFKTRITVPLLFQCLNERALHKKSTIISTNLDIDDLKEDYTERVFSRIIETFSFAEFTGTDLRYRNAGLSATEKTKTKQA